MTEAAAGYPPPRISSELQGVVRSLRERLISLDLVAAADDQRRPLVQARPSQQSATSDPSFDEELSLPTDDSIPKSTVCSCQG